MKGRSSKPSTSLLAFAAGTFVFPTPSRSRHSVICRFLCFYNTSCRSRNCPFPGVLMTCVFGSCHLMGLQMWEPKMSFWKLSTVFSLLRWLQCRTANVRILRLAWKSEGGQAPRKCIPQNWGYCTTFNCPRIFQTTKSDTEPMRVECGVNDEGGMSGRPYTKFHVTPPSKSKGVQDREHKGEVRVGSECLTEPKQNFEFPGSPNMF